jgi:ABC-type glycerol-3-phosphate transport system substrate-binding protein
VAQPVKIEVWALSNSVPGEPAYKNLLATLQKEAPHVTAEVVAGGNLTQLQNFMSAGTPPDIARAIILDLGTIYARNLAVPAAQALKGSRFWLPDAFLPGLRGSHSFKGELVAVPMVTSSAPLGVNLDLLERAGLKVPTPEWTWDDLIEYATKLTLRSGSETTQWGWVSFGAADTVATNEFNTMLHSFGGAWLDASGTKAAFNSPAGQGALEWMVDIFRRRQLSPWPWPAAWTAGGGPLGGRNLAFQLANAGGAAMVVHELEDLPRLEANIAFPWQVVQPPRKTKNAAHQSGFSWFIPRGARQLDGATAFLRTAALPESLARWSLDQGRLPTHEAAAVRPEWQARLKEKPIMQAYLNAAKVGSTYPGIAGWTDARSVLAAAIGQAINGDATPKAALDDAARQADAIFEQARG